jgi:hypothetical protein
MKPPYQLSGLMVKMMRILKLKLLVLELNAENPLILLKTMLLLLLERV